MCFLGVCLAGDPDLGSRHIFEIVERQITFHLRNLISNYVTLTYTLIKSISICNIIFFFTSLYRHNYSVNVYYDQFLAFFFNIRTIFITFRIPVYGEHFLNLSIYNIFKRFFVLPIHLLNLSNLHLYPTSFSNYSLRSQAPSFFLPFRSVTGI